MHYQIHRGIGIHQQKANKEKKPLKVSIFIGGSPAQIFSAIMPLPENVPELYVIDALSSIFPVM